jgi:nucleotide-binding universal stress UspA family protein
MNMAGRLVMGYDGSEDAAQALEFAARMLSAECAIVVNVWSDPAVTLAPAPMVAPPALLPREMTADLEQTARRLAEEGADRARAAGLDALAVVRPGGGPRDIARTLQEVAHDYAGDLIVVGHRHASMLESALLGSVSVSAVREERTPVLVVPVP